MIRPAYRALLAALLASFAGASVCAAGNLNGYRCNTHTHTSARPQSDANESPQFAVDWYKAHGYQCLVITDHEYLTDVAPLNEPDSDFLVIRGQEITQQLEDPANLGGVRHLHVNGIGIDKLILPLGHPGRAKGMVASAIYQRNLDEVLAAGGIAQVNHPNLMWSVTAPDLLPLRQPFLMEVWNAFATSNNLGGVDDNGKRGASTEELWDTLLTNGKIVWGTATDDVHEYHAFDDREAPTPGKGWIVIQAPELTAPAILSALRQGKFYASTGISLASYSADASGVSLQIAPSREWSPSLRPSARFVTKFIGPKGQVLAEVQGHSAAYRFKGREAYVRASIIDSDGRRAWTQPFFRDGRR